MRKNIKLLFNKYLKLFQKKIQNIYKINLGNSCFIIIVTFIFAGVFEFFRFIVPKIFNIHLNWITEIDYLTLYSTMLSLIIPLAIMILEKFNKNKDFIEVETYLKNTMLFPFIFYFCTNIGIFSVLNEQYYFIFTCVITLLCILFMYFQCFKLISDLIYEKKKISDTRDKIVNDDLAIQVKPFEEKNIKNYAKYGIVLIKENYYYTKDYKYKPIFPIEELRIIQQYNYGILDKIAKKLESINKDCIKNIDNNSKNLDCFYVRPKIIIGISELGETTNKDKSYINIYYDGKYQQQAKEIINLITDKIYVLSENNIYYYLLANYEYLQEKCVYAINNSSTKMFESSLEKYVDIYKSYIKGIKIKIGDFSYLESYERTHMFYEPKLYEIFNQIQKEIISFSEIIIKQDNASLMKELIHFLYSLLNYSINKKELLSIQYLHKNNYYLAVYSLKLKDEDAYQYLIFQLFEFIKILEFNLNLENGKFNRDVLLICNKTIGDILYEIRNNDKYFYSYLDKIIKFIKELNKKLNQIKRYKNVANLELIKIYKKLKSNYECNIFAILAYIIKSFEKDEKNFVDILNVYVKYDEEELTNILLDTIYKDYNDRTYSWDLLEEHDDGEAWYSSTQTYLIHFYCLILNNKKNVIIPLNYELSTHIDDIIRELEKLQNKNLIDKFKLMKNKIEENKKEYLRNTPISEKRVEEFINNFKDKYYKNNNLYNLLKETNNIIFVNTPKKGTNFLGISHITDKTYFLEKLLYNENIVWTNFEDCFVDAFINSEEAKYEMLLSNKSSLLSIDIFTYLKTNDLDYSKFIIFADYYTIHSIFQEEDIVYEVPNNVNYKVLNSSHYLKYNNNYIPIYSLNCLESDCILLFRIDELGKMERNGDFKIAISDFYNNRKLIDKYMNTNVEGLILQGEERKNYLLESVKIFIQEYVRFDISNMKGLKFKK